MTSRTLASAAAAAYLAFTLWLSYGVWGPYDGVEHDPSWANGDGFLVVLLVIHACVGAAVGRVWAIALPIAWAVLSVPADGYDAPVWALVVSGLWLWIPAVLVGLAARWLVDRAVAARAA
jgi:hypothetical protein